jgi:small subunit ribosomal protein S1
MNREFRTWMMSDEIQPVVENTAVPVVNETPAEPIEAKPTEGQPAEAKSPEAQPGKGDRPKKSFKDRFKEGGKSSRVVAELPPMQTTNLSLRDLDKSIEAELAAAFGEISVDDQLGDPTKVVQKAAGPNTIRNLPTEPRTGPKTAPTGPKKGTVVAIRGMDVFIDIPGGRSQGVISLMQFPTPPQIGEWVEYNYEGFDKENGLLRLTKGGSVSAVAVDWSSVRRGSVVEGKVTATNKGGLTIEINGIRGFMPIGHIDLNRVENVEQYVNQRLVCVVTEVDPEERNLVVSRREFLNRERAALADKLWESLQEGELRSGTVRSLQKFGVFVDLGGADGLIPMGELAWQRIATAEEVVSVGQKVEVKVMRLDREAKRISLSLRQARTSPWDAVTTTFHPGMRVTGPVTRITEFGAFVQLEPGIEGMVHISELGTSRIRRVRDVLTEGQTVEVQIVSIDVPQRRIALSLKVIAAAVEAVAKTEAERIAQAKQAAIDAEEDRLLAIEQAKRASQPQKNYRGGTGGGKDLFPQLGGK